MNIVDFAPELGFLHTAIVNCYFYGRPGAGDRRWVLVDAGVPGFAGSIARAASHRFGRTRLTVVLLALTVVVALRAQQATTIPGPQGTHTENGLAGFAKILCSGVFVSGREPDDVARGSAYFFMPQAEQNNVTYTVDRQARLAGQPRRPRPPDGPGERPPSRRPQR